MTQMSHDTKPSPVGIDDELRSTHSDQTFNTEYYTRRILKEAEIRSIANLWKDPDCRSVYGNFIETQISTQSLLLLAVLLTLSLGTHLALRLLIDIKSFNSPTLFMAFLNTSRVVQKIIVIALSWLIWYLKRARKYEIKNWFVEAYSDWIPHIQATLTILWSTFAANVLIHKACQDQCNHTSSIMEVFFDQTTIGLDFECNINHDTGGLPFTHLAIALLVPLTIFTVLPDTQIWALATSFSISCASIIAAGALSSYNQMLPGASIYFVCSLLIIYETQRQKVALFLVAEKLHDLLAENERTAEKAHATEMRHMIANVAHDLKTPLSSFDAGVEMITQILSDLKSNLHRRIEDVNPRRLFKYIEEISACVGDIHSTNAFMIMTINRCIDYTKASKGIKLVPKLETVDLQDTINLPLRVVSSLKAAVRIRMSPLSADPSVCSHVITDKQWLQENLLCLLSNAIKYSSRGTVDISVSVVDGAQLVEQSSDESCNEKDVFRRASSSSNPSKRVFDKPNAAVRFRSATLVGEVRSATRAATKQALSSESNHSSASDSDLTTREQVMESDDLYLKFELEDTGIGLSVDARRSLFKPFKQAQRLAGGTGLGLFSLAKRMEALGGHCGVTTRRDKEQGSLFWFAFPYRPDAESAATAAEAIQDHRIIIPSLTIAADSLKNDCELTDAESFSGTTISTSSPDSSNTSNSPLRILLVDDSLSILKMTRMALKRHKHEVVTAENGMEALEIITDGYRKLQEQQQQMRVSTDSDSDPDSVTTTALTGLSTSPPLPMTPFDVVLMDMNMPVMDGLESVRRIRKFESELRSAHNQGGDSGTEEDQNGKMRHGRLFDQFIIGVTANSDQQTMQDSQDVGMDAFIPKPFKVDLLNELMQQHHSTVVHK